MQFEDKKLTPEAVNGLFQSAVVGIEPYTLMLSPVYVFMKRNEKFVSVKAPLDFFTAEELEKLKVYEVFYFPKFVKNSVRYQTAGRLVQSMFKNPMGTMRELEYAPYEYANEILKIIGKLWGKEMSIEPFFMAIFAHELCGSLPAEIMLSAREKTVVNHDWGLLLAGVFVYIAVHLGYYDLNQLTLHRDQIYSRTVEGETWDAPTNEMELMVYELNELMKVKTAFSMDDFIEIHSDWSNKLISRLERIKKTFSKRAENAPSIYGSEGFAA